MGLFDDSNFTPEEIMQILDDYFADVAKRQYIGARYVPTFGRKDETSIEWDNTGAYEPLTIVTYQGNSYTSRQYVPAGTEITDELYWASTGIYNAQIEAYRAEVMRFDGRITTVEGEYQGLVDGLHDLGEYTEREISRVDGRIDDTNGNVSNLTTRVGTAEGDITTLQGNVRDLGLADTALGNRITTLETDANANKVEANVKLFGAVGDGVTDDTEAFQAALATGYDVYIPCLNNEIYLITDTLTLETSGQTVYSDFQGRTIRFATDTQDKVLFLVKRPCKLEGITASRVKLDPENLDVFAGIAVRAIEDPEDPTQRNDTDVLLERCGFTQFYTTVSYEGRGILCSHCQFTNTQYAIHLTWENDTESDDIHGNALGFRSHRIIGCRFHSVQTCCILIESNTPTNSVNLTGILIANNMVDYGRGRFVWAKCGFRYGTIVGNYLAYLSQRTLDFEGTVYNTVISGNNFYCDSRFLSAYYAIYFGASVTGVTINGNSFSNQNHGIRFDDQANSVSIVGNTFNSVANYAIMASAAWNRVAVIGNTGNIANDTNRCLVLMSGNPTINHSKITLNSCTVTEDITGNYTNSDSTITDNYIS